MNSFRRLILTTIFVSVTLIAFARAGFAERWEESWAQDCFFGITIFVVQAIVLILLLIIGRKRTTFCNMIMVLCKKIAGNRYLQILIGGLLLSVNIGIYVDCIFGGLFIFGPLVLFGVMILNFTFAVSPKYCKLLSNPKVVYYLLILLIIAPIGVIAYHYAIQWTLLDKLYSYEMVIDSAFDDTITVKPAALPHHFFTHILIYAFALYIPFVFGLVTKQLYDYVSSLFAKSKIHGKSGNEMDTFVRRK